MAGNANSGGHNKQASQSHVLTGTFRKDRHGNHEAPEPPPGKPKAPRSLTGAARAEWTRMVERMEQSHTLTLVDDGALYQYARLFGETEAVTTDNVETRKLSTLLKAQLGKLDGAELVAAVGEIVKLRQVLAKQTSQLRQQRMALRQYLVEFGMTPSARGRVKVQAKKQLSKVEQFKAQHA